jgi:hypothetical protein
LFSWTGYSRRYLPYAATWCTDLIFLIPAVIITIILGLPMADAKCPSVAENGKFEVTTPPGSAVGKVSFPGDGRAACQRLVAVWVLLIVVCALFALSALSVGFLDLGERQLRKAIFAVREEPRGGNIGGGYYSQEMEDTRGRGFGPTPATQPGATWSAVGNDGSGMMNDYGYQTPPLRPSIGEDRLNLNRPVTLAPPRGGNRAAGTALRYEEPLGQPPAARMPRMRPENGFGLPGTPRAG